MAEMAPLSTSSRGPMDHVFLAIYAILACIGLYYIRIDSSNTIVPIALQSISTSGTWKEYGHDLPVRLQYTGIKWLDFGLAFVVTAFLPGAGSLDAGFWIQQLYFLINFFAVVSLWTIEASRRRNKGKVISYTSIWALFYQTIGGAVIMPLYYIAYLWDSRDSGYSSPSSRTIGHATSKALWPALVIGYLIPTIAMYLPYSDNTTTKFTTQLMVAIWQFSPVYVNILLVILSACFSTTPAPENEPTQADLPWLRKVYATVIGVGAVTHITTIINLLYWPTSDPKYTFKHAFVLIFSQSPSASADSLDQFSISMLRVFQWDFWIIFTASFIWAWQALWDLNRVAQTKINLWVSAIAMIAGSFLLGPAAVLGAVWYYREEKIASAAMIKEEHKKL